MTNFIELWRKETSIGLKHRAGKNNQALIGEQCFRKKIVICKKKMRLRRTRWKC